MLDEAMEAILDVLPVGILILDSQGRLVHGNELGLTSLGVDQMAIGRTDFAELVQNNNLREALDKAATGIFQCDLHLSGRTFQAQIRPLPSDEGHRLITLRDVTGMTRALTLRMNFISEVFHKIGTPLTTVMNVMSIATSGQVDPEKVDLGEVLQMGKGEVERLRGLLGRLRDLFLIDAGCLDKDIEVRRVDSTRVLERIVREFEGRVRDRSQTLETTFPAPGPTILADPEALSRALRAILTNANSFTQAMGTIRVASRIEQEHLCIKVEDDGPGIPEEDLPVIFRRFRRGSNAHSVDGEGLGLFLAQELLQHQGGSVHLDSKVGEGTKVEIYLPLAEMEE